MIAWLQGFVVSSRPDQSRIVLNVGGVGYGIELACPPERPFPQKSDPLELHISTSVSESAIRLFGFLDPAGKEMFEVVTGVSGVGPKLGLALLSAYSSSDLAQAVLSGNLKALTAVPGVGQKTASRLVLELKDRVLAFCDQSHTAPGISATSLLGGSDLSPEEADVAAALVSMGVRSPSAEKAAQKARKILGDGANFQELIREALKHKNAS
jgi:Holliday junction DNA helicase RuvA